MGLFKRPPKLRLSDYRDFNSLTADKKFTLKVYAMYSVGANPLGPNNQYLSESEINEILRKKSVDPNDYAHICGLLIDRGLMKILS